MNNYFNARKCFPKTEILDKYFKNLKVERIFNISVRSWISMSLSVTKVQVVQNFSAVGQTSCDGWFCSWYWLHAHGKYKHEGAACYRISKIEKATNYLGHPVGKDDFENRWRAFKFWLAGILADWLHPFHRYLLINSSLTVIINSIMQSSICMFKITWN